MKIFNSIGLGLGVILAAIGATTSSTFILVCGGASIALFALATLSESDGSHEG